MWEKQIAWVQFDEPALVLDMSDEDKKLFHEIYDALLACSTDTKYYCRHILEIYVTFMRML